jgi:hypothetical protein
MCRACTPNTAEAGLIDLIITAGPSPSSLARVGSVRVLVAVLRVVAPVVRVVISGTAEKEAESRAEAVVVVAVEILLKREFRCLSLLLLSSA